MTGERQCVECGASIDGMHHMAVVCSEACRTVRQRKHRAKWGMKNREYLSSANRVYREKNHDRYCEYQYRRRYGLTFAQVEAMWIAQDKQCAICKEQIRLRGAKGRDKAIVDHCHDSGNVRGLLCTPCNLMIGYANDRATVLSNAIEYLSEVA